MLTRIASRIRKHVKMIIVFREIYC